MKNNRLKLSLAAFGLVLAMVSSTTNSIAQVEPLCKWNRIYLACFTAAPDGYCAYGGADCTTTIPTVE